MAVNDNTQNTQAKAAPAPAPQVERPQFEREQTNQPQGARLTDINRILGGVMSRRTSGEALVDAIKAARYWLDPERSLEGGGGLDHSKFQVLGLDAQEHGLGASAAIVCYPVDRGQTIEVLVNTLVLEATVDGIGDSRYVDVNGRSYALPVLAGDFVTESYMATVQDIVLKAFSNQRKAIEVVSAGWRVVSSKVNFAEAEDQMVRNVLFYSQAAITAMYNERYHADTYFSLDWLSRDSQLEIAVDMSGRPVLTADGLPRRSDLAISVAGQVRKGDNTVNVPLANIGGYVSLLYTPPQRQSGWSRRGQQDEPCFTPTFIINRMDTNTNSITPELLLLAMAASSVVSRNEAWAQNFIPGDVSEDGVDVRDSGLLNILGPDEDNSPIVFDNRKSLDTNRWGEYFFSLVNQQLAWAIELEEGGDNSWITSLLLDAAEDSSGAAVHRLYDYADRLTGGHFTRRAQELGVEQPLVHSGARYLTGTWVDAHGQERDLREWDLLRWMATNPKDGGDAALRYQAIIDQSDVAQEIRVSEQYQQLVETMGVQSVKPARYVDLVFINPAFIEALALAVSDNKINIDQKSTAYTFGAPRVRGNTRVRDFVGGDLTRGKFNRIQGGQGGPRSLRQHMGNGFGRGRF